MHILISACLLGTCCKYDGGHNYHPSLVQTLRKHGHQLHPVCPEQLGGLSTPRIPCEIQHDRIIGKDGKDYTTFFEKGVSKALEVVEQYPIDLAILQPSSPSCGASKIYDGTFSGRLIDGQGYFTRKLKELNIPIIEADTKLNISIVLSEKMD